MFVGTDVSVSACETGMRGYAKPACDRVGRLLATLLARFAGHVADYAGAGEDFD